MPPLPISLIYCILSASIGKNDVLKFLSLQGVFETGDSTLVGSVEEAVSELELLEESET